MKSRADLPLTSIDEMLAYCQTLKKPLHLLPLAIDYNVSFNLEFLMHNYLCHRSNFFQYSWCGTYTLHLSDSSHMLKSPHTEKEIQIKRLDENDLS